MLVIGVGSLLAAGAELAILVHQRAPWVADLFPAVALVYVAAGLSAWLRRPGSRLGFLIVVTGGVWLINGLGNIDVPLLVAVGQVTRTLALAVIVQLLLSFPTGRLGGRSQRLVVAAGFFVCLVLEIPIYAFEPGTILTIADRHDLAQAGLHVQRSAGALVVIATATLLARKLRRGTPAQRRVLAPLAVYGIFALLLIPVSSAFATTLFGRGLWLPAVQLGLMSLVPLAFVAAVSRGGFQRTLEIAELGAWLGAEEAHRPSLREALATALGDPSLRLLYRLPGDEGLVDELGVKVTRSSGDDRRGLVDISLAGETVGAIAYDGVLLDRPEEVRTAGRVVALAVDRQRLIVQLRASRARIVAAADEERRRIARDLHDGLQSRLVLLAVQAGTAADHATLHYGLEAAIDELRELVNGVMPAQLTERGLAAAVADLADRLPIPIALRAGGLERRLEPEIETAAYFVISEAIANAVKHSGSRSLEVSLERANGNLNVEVSDDGAGGARIGGTGIRGMADRVAAVAGELTIESELGHGTRVRAVIPCRS